MTRKGFHKVAYRNSLGCFGSPSDSVAGVFKYYPPYDLGSGFLRPYAIQFVTPKRPNGEIGAYLRSACCMRGCFLPYAGVAD